MQTASFIQLWLLDWQCDHSEPALHQVSVVSSFVTLTLLVLQVLAAAEEALRRLQVSGAERNAILDTLRYVDSLAERTRAVEAEEAAAAAASHTAEQAAAEESASMAESSESKPFTRCSWLLHGTVSDTMDLIRSI